MPQSVRHAPDAGRVVDRRGDQEGDLLLGPDDDGVVEPLVDHDVAESRRRIVLRGPGGRAGQGGDGQGGAEGGGGDGGGGGA
ncbi:hypothetical protein FNH09_30465 [Streptomyces adustus]|uniref:Uncharacterized protein n=1 Tax=Streptomyces adustus TaxID=1609272 RepID=A0A5N8VJM6_9ACTN|nr:hypothetical protein [Streptomyces adustus]